MRRRAAWRFYKLQIKPPYSVQATVVLAALTRYIPGTTNMNSRPVILLALISVFTSISFVSEPLSAENDLTSTIDPEQLGRVAKEWAYPEENTLSLKPGIGKIFPLHLVLTQTKDSFVSVCRYYTRKCGHKSFDDIDLRATGESSDGIYLIRDHRTDTSAEVPRVIFMHYNKNHTVTVTVMRPPKSSQTQVDVCVSVR